MVAVGGIVQRAGLVNDAHAALLRLDDDTGNLVEPLRHFGMQRERGFDGGLRVELGGKRNFEQHVFHDVTAKTLRGNFYFLAAKENVLKAPRLRREHARITHLAFERRQRQPHRAARRVARRPAFARAGVRRVAIRPQRAAVHERQRKRVDDLLARAAEQTRCNCRRSDAHQQHMIEADAVESIFQSEHALNFMCLNHRYQHIAYR